MKFLISALLVLLAFNSHASDSKKLAVLVPGLFNQLLPEAPDSLQQKYPSRMVSSCFSEAIIDEFVTNEFDVIAFPPLDWTLNEEDILTVLTKRVNTHISKHYTAKVDVYLFGHSAGGLLSLKLASRINGNVKKIFAMGTPFYGSPAANALAGGSIRQSILGLLDSLTGGSLDLGAIEFVNTENAKSFLSEVVLPDEIEIISVFGVQKKNRSFFPSLKAEVQSLLFVPLQIFMPKISDGVVTPESAIPSDYVFRTYRNSKVVIREAVAAELDHAELIIDARSLKSLVATSNPEFVSKGQTELYRRLISDFIFSD